MATFGVDFRTTAGFVTDPTDYTYCLGESYPVTRGGITFGWGGNSGGILLVDKRDRNNGIDPRLAGINFVVGSGVGGGSLSYFQLDKTGAATVRLACGDADNAQTVDFAIADSAGNKFTGSGATSAGGEFWDASGVIRTTPADWVTNNAASAQYTFADYLRYNITDTVNLNVGEIATLVFIEAGGGGSVVPWAHRFSRIAGQGVS